MKSVEKGKKNEISRKGGKELNQQKRGKRIKLVEKGEKNKINRKGGKNEISRKRGKK